MGWSQALVPSDPKSMVSLRVCFLEACCLLSFLFPPDVISQDIPATWLNTSFYRNPFCLHPWLCSWLPWGDPDCWPWLAWEVWAQPKCWVLKEWNETDSVLHKILNSASGKGSPSLGRIGEAAMRVSSRGLFYRQKCYCFYLHFICLAVITHSPVGLMWTESLC